jgi:hypothetical protein
MVNTCELLINVVNLNKLKMLISFNQKVRGWLSLFQIATRRHKTYGEQAEPNPSISYISGTW